MMKLRPLALTVAACASLTALVGCSSSSAPSDDTSAASSAPETSAAASGGDFCAEYADAGGTLATPSNFQVGLPADETISDLSGRVAVMDAVTPPSEIESAWQSTRGLYAEGVEIAEAVPDKSSPVLDSRIFAIVKELSGPTGDIRAYLDATC